MRTLLTLVLLAAGLYVGLGVLLYLMQGRMVFLADLPSRALFATPENIGLAYQDVTLTTADGEQLHGWFVPARNSAGDGAGDGPNAEAGTGIPTGGAAIAEAGAGRSTRTGAVARTGTGTGTVLFFHGNAGNISHRLDSLAIFHRLGLATLIIDYRGYGQSTGSPSEAGTYRDAEAAWRYLVDERGIAPEQIIIFGRSLGGAVGAWLGSQVRPAGVIVESSFSSGVDMARRLYPFLPARLLTRLRYPVVDYVRDLQAPLLVVHSRDDEIIPFDMAQTIYAAAPQPKTLLELRGDHNTGFLHSRARYVAGLAAFVEEALAD